MRQDHQRVSRNQEAPDPTRDLLLAVEVGEGDAALEVLLEEEKVRNAGTDHEDSHEHVERIRPIVGLMPILVQDIVFKLVEKDCRYCKRQIARDETDG